jgi:hypothetical protein
MRRHDTDSLSLLGGLLFMGLGIAFLLDALDRWSADVTWIPPIVLIVLGLAGVLSTVGRRAPALPDGPADGVVERVGDPIVGAADPIADALAEPPTTSTTGEPDPPGADQAARE